VVIQNNNILFKNKIFDDIVYNFKNDKSKDQFNIMHKKLFKINKKETEDENLESSNNVGPNELGISLTQLLNID
jgi:hypothetical protein